MWRFKLLPLEWCFYFCFLHKIWRRKDIEYIRKFVAPWQGTSKEDRWWRKAPLRAATSEWTEFLATGWSVVTPIAYYILLCSPFVIGVVVFLSRLVSFEIQFFIWCTSSLETAFSFHLVADEHWLHSWSWFCEATHESVASRQHNSTPRCLWCSALYALTCRCRGGRSVPRFQVEWGDEPEKVTIHVNRTIGVVWRNLGETQNRKQSKSLTKGEKEKTEERNHGSKEGKKWVIAESRVLSHWDVPYSLTRSEEGIFSKLEPR